MVCTRCYKDNENFYEEGESMCDDFGKVCVYGVYTNNNIGR